MSRSDEDSVSTVSPRLGQRFFAIYSRLVLQWPLATALFMVALCAALASGLPKVQTSDSYRMYFGPENPDLQAVDEFEAEFEQYEEIIFVARSVSGNLFTPGTLEGLRELTRRSWNIEYATRVNSVINFRHSEAVDDDVAIEPVVPEFDEITPKIAARAREIALNSEELSNLMVGPAGDATMMVVTIQFPDGVDQAKAATSAAEAGRLIKRIEAEFPDLQLHAAGRIMLTYNVAEAGKTMLKELMPLLALFLVVALYFFLRSIVGVIVTVLVVQLSVMAAFGVVGHLGIVTNTVSNAARLIILTLAVADSVHVLATYFYELSRRSDSGDEISLPRRDQRVAAMLESLRVNLFPVTLTSITTAIGFLAMNFSDSPPFVDLGNITAIGVTVAWILSLTLLPAVTVLLPVRPSAAVQRAQLKMGKFGDWVIANRRVLLLSILIVLLLSLAGLPRNHFGDNYAKHFPPGNDFRDAVDMINERVAAERSVQYVLDSGASNAVYSPEFLQNMQRLVNFIESQPNVHKVSGLHLLMKRLNRTMHGDIASEYKLPESRELAAQYLLLYELSLPQGLSLNNVVGVDRRRTAITVRFNEITAGEVLEFEAALQAWAMTELPEGLLSNGLGSAVMFANISERNFRSMISGTLLAIVTISVLLVFALRSWKLGLLSMLPNLAPILAGFGIWGWWNGSLGMSLSVVGSMTLGIVVDDTVHLLSKYQRARKELDNSPEDALRYAFSTTGMALWITTVVLVGCFLVLSSLPFAPVATMMQMAAIIVLVALLFDFLFLPGLLLLLSRRFTLSGAKPTAALRSR